MTQDLRICLRGLLRAPLMTLTIVATVGLGIGGTTAIFAAVDAALLRPLPYADPDRIVRIYTDAPPNRFRFSVADYLALEEQQTHFAPIAGYTDRPMAYAAADSAERLRGRVVTTTYFSLLGIRPALGRDFSEADGRPGNPPAVIVSHGFWQRRLAGRPDVIGMPVRLDGSDHMLAGVLPRTVGPLEQGQEFFVAARWEPPRRKGPFFITVVARLRPDVTASSAAEELRAINRRIFPLWQASYQDDRATWGIMELRTHVTGDVGTIAALAIAAVALVWLIACTNASNLLIARVTSRQRELAVRAALGASRGRVVRYLLAESLLLAIVSAAVGVALAWAGIVLVRDFGAGYFPRTQEIALDARVLWVLAALTGASGLLFGAVPALHGSGGSLDDSLRSMGRTSTASRAVRRLRRILVGSEFAIATPLLVVAALLLVSLNELSRVDLGFDSRNVISGSIALPATQYTEPGRAAGFWNELQQRVESLPGVSAVAYSDGRPPNEAGQHNNFELEAAPTAQGQSPPVTAWIAVTPSYFQFLGLSLLEGRLLEERDALTENVEAVVVDRAWARRFFPGGTALGQRFRQGGCTTCPWTNVVGIVSDVRYDGLDRPEQGTVYWPMTDGVRTRYLMLRTAADPTTVVPAIRQALRQLDASLPLSSVATIDDLVDRSMQRPRSLSALVGGFAVVALLLSVIGIYGVMAYYVQQHARDISIRLALGGSPADVLGLVVREGMKVVAGGVLVGLVAALVMTRLAASLLFGVGGNAAAAVAAVAVLLVGIALAACAVPARRAVALAPADVLRSE